MREHRLLGILFAIGAHVIFGLSFLFSRASLVLGVPVLLLLSLRFLVAFLSMAALIATGVFRVDYRGKPLWALAPLVVLQPVVYFLCESFGIQRTSSSEAGIIIALLPILTFVLSYFLLGERLSVRQAASVLVSISGAAMIVVLSGSRPTFDLPGILLLFAAVLAGSAFNMVARRLATHFSSVEITFAMMATGVVFFGGAAAVDRLLAEDPAPLAVYLSEPMFLVSLAYLGVFSSVFAFVLLNLTVRRLGATRTASFANLTTVVSIAAGTIVLRESLSWYHFVGSGLILAGVWGANRKAGEAASPDAGPTPAALSEHPDRSDPGQSGSASSDR